MVALEPSSENIDILSKNLAQFPQVEVLQGAVGRRAGTGQFADPHANYDAFQVVETKAASDATAFQIFSLEELRNKDTFDFVKCDIEGTEWDIFRSPDGSVSSFILSTNLFAIEVHEAPEGCHLEEFRETFLSCKMTEFMSGEDTCFVRRVN